MNELGDYGLNFGAGMLKIETAAAGSIMLVLNGRRVETPARLLSDLVAAHGFGELRVATALNGVFVAAARRDTTTLSPGDRVEIVSARQGG